MRKMFIKSHILRRYVCFSRASTRECERMRVRFKCVEKALIEILALQIFGRCWRCLSFIITFLVSEKGIEISGEFYHRTCLCLIGIHQANPIKSILSQHEIHIFPRRSVPRIYTVLQYTRDTRTHGSRSIPSDVIKIKSPWKLIAQRNFRNPSASFCCCSLENL